MAIIQDPTYIGRRGAGKAGDPSEGYRGPAEQEPQGPGVSRPGGPVAEPPAPPAPWSPWWATEVTAGAPVDYEAAAAEEARRKQMEIIQMLQRQAQGDPNSIMQQQLQAAGAAARGQLGGAAAARGNFGGAGAGMRQVRAAQGANSRQQLDDSRVLMLQEQQAAMGALRAMYQKSQEQDAAAATGAAQNALGNYATEDEFIKAMLGIDTQFNVDRTQEDTNAALVKLGLLDERRQSNNALANDLTQSLATGAGALHHALTPTGYGEPRPGYGSGRSIVEAGDK